MSFYDPIHPRKRVTSRASGAESITEQSQSKECDVHYILDKFTKTGLITHKRNFEGHYADISQFPDLQGALQTVFAAQDAFAELPSSVRKRFQHDPFQFVEFMQNPANLEEMKSLGLATGHLSPPASPEAPKTAS